jgi:hypothetical protein
VIEVKIKDIEYAHFSIHLPDDMGKTKLAITPEYIELLKYVVANPPKGVFLFNHHIGNVHPDIRDIVEFSHVLTINDRAGKLNIEDD